MSEHPRLLNLVLFVLVVPSAVFPLRTMIGRHFAFLLFYVFEVVRRVFFPSRDGQEPTPTTQTSLMNDPRQRMIPRAGAPKGPGPLGYSGKVKIVFAC